MSKKEIKILMDSLCIFSGSSSSPTHDEVAKAIIVAIHTEQETMGLAERDDWFDKLQAI